MATWKKICFEESLIEHSGTKYNVHGVDEIESVSGAQQKVNDHASEIATHGVDKIADESTVQSFAISITIALG